MSWLRGRRGRDERYEAERSALQAAVGELSSERDNVERYRDFASRLALVPELGELGAVMLRELCRLTPADAAALYVTDARGGTDRFWLAEASGFDSEALAPLIAPGEGFSGRAAAERRPISVSHPDTVLRIPALGGVLEVRNELHLPIHRGEEVLGVIALARAEEPSFDTELEGLGSLMEAAASALSNALSLRAAADAAELNRAVLESAQDAYVATDEQGTVVAWSPQASELFGCSEEEAVGRSFEQLALPEASRPEHSRRHTRIVAQGRQGSQLERFQVWTRGAASPARLAEMSISVVRRGSGLMIAYFARDITQVHQRELLRRAEEEVSRTLAEAGPEDDPIEPILAALGMNLGWAYGCFWEYEERTKRLRCARIWGGEEDEVDDLAHFALGETLDPAATVDPEDAGLRHAWESGEANWTAIGDMPLLSERLAAARALGVEAELMLPVRSSEGMLGIIEFGAISAERPDADTLHSLRSITDLVGQVVERRRAEEEAERLKDEFFALVSHELRTPLTSVIGYLDIVREGEAGEINEEQRHYLEVIDRNASRLLRLVGDLLFVAQVEAGTLSLERGEVDLQSVCEASVEAARPRADKQGVLLAAETEPLTMGSGDADRIGQLVDNLVSNALKFTPEGGSVTVRLARIEGERARIEVVDTGMGISAEAQEHLFERFYRADAATRSSIPGIGLGLSICLAIAEGHGGSIDLESEEGRGTTFRVELPLAQPEPARAEPVPAQPQPQ